MPLSIGTWEIFANGSSGNLLVPAYDGSGNLDPSSTVYGQPIFGFWDEPAQKITFVRVPTPNSDGASYQIFTGYQFGGPNGVYLTGSFEAFAGSGATAQQSVFGWYDYMSTIQ